MESTLSQLLIDINCSYNAEKQEKNDDFKYIGTGNPVADILIIGKEVGFNLSDENQYIREVKGNYNDWCQIAQNGSISNDKYNPRFPYPNQLFKVNSKNGNGGTSKTWYNYQKLRNQIYTPNAEKIDFHNHFFITEVNSSPSKKTKEADTSSIAFRKKHILSHAFFKKFPVVVISGLGYFDITKQSNEIESLFNVKYIRAKDVGGKNQMYWIHKSEDCARLLINVRQLSMNISDSLLEGIANEIKMHLVL